MKNWFNNVMNEYFVALLHHVIYSIYFLSHKLSYLTSLSLWDICNSYKSPRRKTTSTTHRLGIFWRYLKNFKKRKEFFVDLFILNNNSIIFPCMRHWNKLNFKNICFYYNCAPSKKPSLDKASHVGSCGHPYPENKDPLRQVLLVGSGHIAHHFANYRLGSGYNRKSLPRQPLSIVKNYI